MRGIPASSLDVVRFKAISETMERRIREELEKETDVDILAMEEGPYIEYLASEHSIEPLVVHFDKATQTSQRVDVDYDRMPHDKPSDYRPGQEYSILISTVRIPYTGDRTFLRTRITE